MLLNTKTPNRRRGMGCMMGDKAGKAAKCYQSDSYKYEQYNMECCIKSLKQNDKPNKCENNYHGLKVAILKRIYSRFS